MANTGFVDVCRFRAVSTGTVDFVVSAAITGYQTPASANAVTGTQYRYRAESDDLTQWEIGYGAYTSGSVTLARTTVLFNSSGTTSKINFSAAPQVAIVFLAEDFLATGDIPGTATNDNPTAGSIGQVVQSLNSNTSATVTFSNGSQNITWTGHGLTAAVNNYSACNFTTSGGLPTNFATATEYFITVIDANTLKMSSSVDNAIAGTYITAGSAGTGTQTIITSWPLTTATAVNIGGISLTAGDWDIYSNADFIWGTNTNTTQLVDSISTTTGTTNATATNLQIFNLASLVLNGIGQGLGTTGPVRASLSATTTYYHVVRGNFTVSSLTAYGSIRARRIR